MHGEQEVWAPPVVISGKTALPLCQSEDPVQEFRFFALRSDSGALQVTCYPLGSYVQIMVESTDFSFTGVVTEVDYRTSIVTVII